MMFADTPLGGVDIEGGDLARGDGNGRRSSVAGRNHTLRKKKRSENKHPQQNLWVGSASGSRPRS